MFWRQWNDLCTSTCLHSIMCCTYHGHYACIVKIGDLYYFCCISNVLNIDFIIQVREWYVCIWMGIFFMLLLLSLDYYYSENIKTKWPDQINLAFKICYESYRIFVKNVYSMTYIHNLFKKKKNTLYFSNNRLTIRTWGNSTQTTYPSLLLDILQNFVCFSFKIIIISKMLVNILRHPWKGLKRDIFKKLL